jgi:DNA-binding FrmR family transcriptional regulator
VNYDDETLMAYADGELEPAQRAAIAAAIEKDRDLAERVEKHRALRAEVSGAFAGVLDRHIPERLATAARGNGAAAAEIAAARRGKVVQFPSKAGRAPGPAWTAKEWGALAASVVLAVFISWRVFTPAESALFGANGGALVARGELATALDRQLASDQRREDPVQIGVTFKSRDGSYCRSFTLTAMRTAGLACRAGGDWQVAATSAAEIPAGHVQQAAGAMPAAVLAAIDARIADEALDAAGEDSARLSGWK